MADRVRDEESLRSALYTAAKGWTAWSREGLLAGERSTSEPVLALLPGGQVLCAYRGPGNMSEGELEEAKGRRQVLWTAFDPAHPGDAGAKNKRAVRGGLRGTLASASPGVGVLGDTVVLIHSDQEWNYMERHESARSIAWHTDPDRDPDDEPQDAAKGPKELNIHGRIGEDAAAASSGPAMTFFRDALHLIIPKSIGAQAGQAVRRTTHEGPGWGTWSSASPNEPGPTRGVMGGYIAATVHDDGLHVVWADAEGVVAHGPEKTTRLSTPGQLRHTVFDGTSWSQHTPLGPRHISRRGAALASYDGKLHAVYPDPDSDHLLHTALDGTTWSTPTVIPGHDSHHAPALLTFHHGPHKQPGLLLVHRGAART
ncbi:hypothetical protein [Streptomyces vinaceus]|uniref:hypothetical protein n=1 Tax=Streptomyces vinaceus TaxID=1960 RepID=UPI0037F9CEF2